MSFVGELAGMQGKRAAYPNVDAWVRRLHGRPAYRQAIERDGPYRMAQ